MRRAAFGTFDGNVAHTNGGQAIRSGLQLEDYRGDAPGLVGWPLGYSAANTPLTWSTTASETAAAPPATRTRRMAPARSARKAAVSRRRVGAVRG